MICIRCSSNCKSKEYHLVENFQRRNIHKFHSFRATHQSFLHKVWVCRTHLWWVLAICKSFLCEMVTYRSVKVFSLKSFPLYSISFAPRVFQHMPINISIAMFAISYSTVCKCMVFNMIAVLKLHPLWGRFQQHSLNPLLKMHFHCWYDLIKLRMSSCFANFFLVRIILECQS